MSVRVLPKKPGPLRSFALSSDSHCYVAERITTTIERLRPGVLLISHYGYDDGANAYAYLGVPTEEIERVGYVHVFIDARAETGVSAAARDAAAGWVKQHGERVRSTHLLFKSRVLELAVAVANLLMRGHTQSYANQRDFERAISALAPNFRGLQAPPADLPLPRLCGNPRGRGGERA